MALAIASGAILSAETSPVSWADVSKAVVRFEQVMPGVAGGSAPTQGGHQILANAGIRTVIDLRTPAEGTEAARERAEAAALRYFNLPVSGKPPSRDVVEGFAELMADANNRPLYFHCRSGVRAGTLWAIYRRIGSVALDQAISEGKAIGMPDERIPQVRDFAIENY